MDNFEILLETALKEDYFEEINSVDNVMFNPSKDFVNKMNRLLGIRPKNLIPKFQKVAGILIVLFGTLALLITFNEDVRAKVQIAIEWFSDHITIEWISEDKESKEFSLESIPDNYLIKNSTNMNSLLIIELIKDDKLILLEIISKDSSASLGIDNENRIIQTRDIKNNKEAIIGIAKSKEYSNIVFIEDDFYYIAEGYVEVDELITLVEKIIENNLK